eukprot:TRINITY_DN2903_c0_g3_i2.p1 TRINITY_DN2903_c0_g3~~TRINITY_DN2903_c0_g3_i2.p1  ORF type:complete len:137 (+),score=28.31 TRINITY_DN2903_c0_g3_i2:217-627(+)
MMSSSLSLLLLLGLGSAVFALPVFDEEGPSLQAENPGQNLLYSPYEDDQPTERQLLEYIRSLEAELNELHAVDPALAAADPGSYHKVDKRRRRRYGFWITAINKMGNGGKRAFFKRSGKFIPYGMSPKLLHYPNYE